MPPKNPLKESAAAAENAVRDLAHITAALGTKDNPQGAVMTAYRAALEAVNALLTADTGRVVNTRSVRDILLTMRAAVRAAVIDGLRSGEGIGAELTVSQLDAYGIDIEPEPLDNEWLTSAASGVMGEVDRQINAALALVIGGASVALIVGDKTRQGVLRPAPVVRDTTNWGTRAANTVVERSAQRAGQRAPFERQAIAAIDDRTTDCCLRVHGQIVAMDEPFKLTGTPRYADEILTPPFHDYCRTVWVLYQADYDDGLTEQMQNAVSAELEQRETEAEQQ